MKKLSNRGGLDIYLILAIVIVIAVGVLVILQIQNSESDDTDMKTDDTSSAISNFDECVAAGNFVMESFPEQCRTEDGDLFVNDVTNSDADVADDESDTNTSDETGEAPTTQYDLTLFGLTVPDEFTETSRASTPDACGDGKTQEMLDLEASDGRYISVLVNDCGRGVNSDVTLSFQYVASTLEFVRPFDMTLCDPGPFCTAGDGSLDVFASTQEESPLGDRYLFFFGNRNSEDVTVDSTEEFLSIIETIVIK